MCVCVILEHISGGAGVQQQPVGALRGRPGPGGGTLSAARAQHRRLAHIQPGRLLQPGSASLWHHGLPTTTCVLCHILWRLVKKKNLQCLQCLSLEMRRREEKLNTASLLFTRFEMQDTSVTQEATLKNISLVPYFHKSPQTAAALSVPA